MSGAEQSERYQNGREAAKSHLVSDADFVSVWGTGETSSADIAPLQSALENTIIATITLPSFKQRYNAPVHRTHIKETRQMEREQQHQTEVKLVNDISDFPYQSLLTLHMPDGLQQIANQHAVKIEFEEMMQPQDNNGDDDENMEDIKEMQFLRVNKMDDDIDIEEHDVLNNPQIKNLFPDLNQIKTEVMQDEVQSELQTINTMADHVEIEDAQVLDSNPQIKNTFSDVTLIKTEVLEEEDGSVHIESIRDLLKPTRKIRKMKAQRQREYRQRVKLKNGIQPVRKSRAAYQREYRLRKKLISDLNNGHSEKNPRQESSRNTGPIQHKTVIESLELPTVKRKRKAQKQIENEEEKTEVLLEEDEFSREDNAVNNLITKVKVGPRTFEVEYPQSEQISDYGRCHTANVIKTVNVTARNIETKQVDDIKFIEEIEIEENSKRIQSCSHKVNKMAVGIDVEEPDVLNNPQIKKILPDLTLIKTEVIQEEDGNTGKTKAQRQREYRQRIKIKNVDKPVKRNRTEYHRNYYWLRKKLKEQLNTPSLNPAQETMTQLMTNPGYIQNEPGVEVTELPDMCPAFKLNTDVLQEEEGEVAVETILKTGRRISKTQAQRQQEYRYRLKLKNGEDTTKRRRAAYLREYRLRKKIKALSDSAEIISRQEAVVTTEHSTLSPVLIKSAFMQFR